MRTPVELLDDMRPAPPCSARWEEMTRDDRARHCGRCDKTVLDLARLTAEDDVALVRAGEGALCFRLFRRADGRVVTADCAPEAEGGRPRFGRWMLTAVAACVG